MDRTWVVWICVWSVLKKHLSTRIILMMDTTWISNGIYLNNYIVTSFIMAAPRTRTYGNQDIACHLWKCIHGWVASAVVNIFTRVFNNTNVINEWFIVHKPFTRLIEGKVNQITWIQCKILKIFSHNSITDLHANKQPVSISEVSQQYNSCIRHCKLHKGNGKENACTFK